MLPIAAGLAALLILLFLTGAFLRSDTRELAKRLRRIAGILLGLAAAGLMVMGRVGLAFLAGSIAWALLAGRALPGRSGSFGSRRSGGGGPNPEGRMSRSEALKVLGLEDGASTDDIRAAHRRLILQAHPDKGGTTYLAAKINEAKDVLLGG